MDGDESIVEPQSTARYVGPGVRDPCEQTLLKAMEPLTRMLDFKATRLLDGASSN